MGERCIECGEPATTWPTPGCVFCAQRAAWGYVDARKGMPDHPKGEAA